MYWYCKQRQKCYIQISKHAVSNYCSQYTATYMMVEGKKSNYHQLRYA